MRKTVRRVVLLVGLCSLVVFLIDRPTILWVGATDLTVEFVVTDADTGLPIEGAEVSVYADEVFPATGGERQFMLRSDQHGSACYVSRDHTCAGAQSTLHFTDTFSVRPPRWRVEVSAPGYAPVESVAVEQYCGKAERTGPQQSKMLIPVALSKSP